MRSHPTSGWRTIMESAWDETQQPLPRPETSNSNSEASKDGAVPVVDEDSLIGTDKHVRYVLRQGSTAAPPPPGPAQPAAQANSPVIVRVNTPMWPVAVLMAITFLIGTTA